MEEDEDAGEETKFEVEEQKSIETLKNENLYRISWQSYVSFIANMYTFGCFTALIGLIIARLKEPTSSIHMTTNEESWFASITLIGSMVGTLISGIQSDIWGRKKTIMAAQLVSLFGLLCLRFASNVSMFYIGSFLGGYTEGLCSVVTAVYTAEISQPRIRNYTLSFNTVLYFLMFSLTYVLASLVSWRQTISIIIPLPCIVFILLFWCPDSPTWHMLKGRNDLAFAILTKLRGNAEAAKMEVERINTNLMEQNILQEERQESSYVKEQLSIMSKGTFIRPCCLLILLFSIGWQWTGEACLTFYTVNIIRNFKIPLSPYWISAGIGCYQLFVSILGIYISAIVPRRKYYIGSGIFVITGAAFLGTIVHLQKYDYFVALLEKYPILQWLPVLALMMYFGGYASGYVTVCYMLLGEVLPSNARSIGSSIVVQLSNISFFISTKSTPYCVEMLGMDGLFWLFSVIAIVFVVFSYFCMPETFGLSLEEIEEHYRKICYSRISKRSTQSMPLSIDNVDV